MKKAIKTIISITTVFMLFVLYSTPIKAWSYTQNKTINGNYISVYYWKFDYSATINYNQMGYITGTQNLTLKNIGCGNVQPLGTGCTIKPKQSSVSHTNTTATYKVKVDSYANASLVLVYIATQDVTIKVVSPGPRSLEPVYEVEISEPYYDKEHESGK